MYRINKIALHIQISENTSILRLKIFNITEILKCRLFIDAHILRTLPEYIHELAL